MNNVLDRTINWFSPAWGLKRQLNRLRLQRAYDGASKGLHTKGWQGVSSSSGNTEVEMAHQMLVNRSHDLIRNNAYALRAQELSVLGWIGEGLKGSIKGPRTLANRRTRDWKEWTVDKREIDFLGQKNFAALQVDVCRAFFAGGECLVRKVVVPDNRTVPIRLQVLEGVHLDMGKTCLADNGNHIVQGVEYGPDGRIGAYWLYDQHPNECRTNRNFFLKSQRVDASDILYIGEPLRPNQCRGLPKLASVIINMKDFGDLRKNKLTQQQIATCFAAFVSGSDTDEDNVKLEEITENLEPGIIEHLGNNRNIHFATPPDADNSTDFDKSILREIAMGTGVSYEDLSGDMSNVSFISGRLGRINFYHLAGLTRNTVLIPMFFDEIYRWFEEASQIAGRGAGSSRIVWTPPPQDSIDPVKQTDWLVKQLDARLISRQEAIRQFGREPDVVDGEIGEDNIDI